MPVLPAAYPSHLSTAYAKNLNAAATLPRNTPVHELIRVATSLISAGSSSEQGSEEAVRDDVQEADKTLSSMFRAASQQQPIPSSALDQGGRAVLAAVRRARVRTWLNVVWRYDDTTYQHCLLVAGLAAAFACQFGLTQKHQRFLAEAGLIHDIGKARIPLTILSKPGKLTAAEMRIMKTHAPLGHSMLVRQSGFDSQLLDIVRHHHEYLDGSGYPDGFRGGQISHFVRIMTICDIYAALIERRSYKAPMPPRQALSVVASMHGKIDPTLVQAFEAVVNET